jgi:hypothetical protein
MNPSALVHARRSLHTLLPSISVETITELEKRGLLHISESQWRLGDGNNGSTRKLSATRWKHADTSGNAWHKLIGLDDVVQNDRHRVMLVIEGSKDALAAAELARRCGMLSQVGIVCALGSGYRPIPNELQQLRGRRVLLIGDNDAAGIQTTQIVSRALAATGINYEVWDWSDHPQKDVYDFLAAMDASREKFLTPRICTFFSSSLPSHSSTVQQFNCSTTQEPGISEEEKRGIVYPFIVTKPGSGNFMSFQLARAIKHRKFSIKEIDQVFHLWFVKSRPLLPPDSDETESLKTFYRQLKRVRFTVSGLEAACERARSARLPFIPARDGDIEIARLAALCRELQRNVGDRPFICPVNVVQEFLGLPWPSQANYLLHTLQDESVIECVDRGSPHRRSEKGKSTLWRYKLPLDPP